MSNLIKTVNSSNNTILEMSYKSESTFMYNIMVALSNAETASIVYQPGTPKNLVSILKNMVTANNANGHKQKITFSEDSLLHPYEKSRVCDTLDPEYWVLRNVDPSKKDISSLNELYNEILKLIEALVETSGINKSQVVFYLRTKNQK